MQLRNIGIVGYAGVFPVVALLLVILFHRETPFIERRLSSRDAARRLKLEAKLRKPKSAQNERCGLSLRTGMVRGQH